MSQSNVRAVVLKMHNDHQVTCPIATENQIVSAIEKVWHEGRLSQSSVQDVVGLLQPRFLVDNKFDNPDQYVRLLWDALRVSELATKPASSETHFHGPVTQTGIFQTGAGSTAGMVQNIQQNVSVTEIHEALKQLRKAAHADLQHVNDREKAIELVDALETQLVEPKPNSTKINRSLKALGKWTGERFTKALDAAIEAAVKAGLGQNLMS